MLSLSKHVRFGLVLAAVLSVSSARSQDRLTLPVIDHIVVRKSERTLTVYAEGEPVHVFEGVQLGDEPTGPKRFQGDERTPEGRYTIDYGNPNSAYHLSLHISYPNAQDTAFARAQGRSPGGLIFIHGQPNEREEEEPIPGDWTDGCIALSNDEIEALWEAVPDGTTIDIFP